MATGLEDRLLTTKEAAAFLGLQEQTLAFWRMTAKNLDYIKVGRAVKYRRSSLEEYLRRRTVGATNA